MVRYVEEIPNQASMADEWLTLEQASKRLGIHSSTLRRWANQGDVNVFLTPGGHRRFLLSDIEQFQRQHHHTRLPADPMSQWADHAIAQTQHDIHQQRWLAAYDEAERQAKRQLGRRLIGLLLQYVVRPDESPDLLMEARIIGEEHARSGVRYGQSLAELLTAIGFFRTTLLEVALLEIPGATTAQPQASSRLLRRIERLLGEVQTGIVELYTARNNEPCA